MIYQDTDNRAVLRFIRSRIEWVEERLELGEFTHELHAILTFLHVEQGRYQRLMAAHQAATIIMSPANSTLPLNYEASGPGNDCDICL